MQYEPFPVHHPHTIGDYLARKISIVLFRFTAPFFRHKPDQFVLFLEASIAMFAMSEASATQYAALTSFGSMRETIEDLLAEASGAHFHLLVAHRFTDPGRLTKYAVWKQRIAGRALFRFISFCSVRMAYRLLAQLEEQASGLYREWFEMLEKSDSEIPPAGHMAIGYWELSEDATLLDALDAMYDDCRKNRELDHQRAEEC